MLLLITEKIIKRTGKTCMSVPRKTTSGSAAPLSYGGLQIMGWGCIVLSAVYTLLNLAGKLNQDYGPRFAVSIEVLNYVAAMSLPLLLLVNFAKILNNEEGYAKQLIRNFGAMAGIFLAFLLFYEYYFIGSLSVFATNPADTEPALNLLVNSFAPDKFFAFNIFVDMFLCTLFMFFLNYRPAKVFTGKKVILFRFLAVLPVAYEVSCMLLKAKAIRGEFMIPVICYPLLGVYGIIVVALITSVVVNFYSEVKAQPDEDKPEAMEDT